MINQRNTIFGLILGAFLLFGQLTQLCASATALPDTLAKCEGLLGKSSSVVLSELGQPDLASVRPWVMSVKDAPELLIWKYDKINEGNNIELLFSNKFLIAVIWNPGTKYNAMNNPNDANEENLIKTYKQSSLKLGYDKSEAVRYLGIETVNLHVVLRETTSSGHLARFYSLIHSNPLMVSHVFNAATGVYHDAVTPKPNLPVSLHDIVHQQGPVILTNGLGEAYESDVVPNTNPNSQIGQRNAFVRYVMLSLVVDDDWNRWAKCTYIPITSSDASWTQ